MTNHGSLLNRRSRRSVLRLMVVAPVTAGALIAARGIARAGEGALPAGPAWKDLQPGGSFDQFLAEQAARGPFSGAVLVAKDGQPILEAGYGMADREQGVANTPETRFIIASMGKMFTGVAIAQLVEQGKLSFDDTIGTYLAEFPADIGDRVTIDQLLTHTAGIAHLALMRTSEAPEPPTSLDGLMERIIEAPLQFEPGSQYSYSNDGFIVLGAIIERVTGQRYEEYVREYVFEPAGMMETDIRVYKPSDVPGMAYGYELVGEDGQPVPRSPDGPPSAQPGTLRRNDTVEVGNPSGGAYSTVGDMLRFAEALRSYRLLSPELTDVVLAGKVQVSPPGVSPDSSYGYGFLNTRVNGVRIVGHNGGRPGFEGQLDIYPDAGYVVVILTNQDQALRPAIRRSEEVLTQ